MTMTLSMSDIQMAEPSGHDADSSIAKFYSLTTPSQPFFLLQAMLTSNYNNSTMSSSPELPTKGSFYQIQQFPLYVVQVIIILFGVVTNAINILTFLKIGLSDCVTISFFNLAVSDLFHLLCFGIIRMMTILQYEHGISSPIVRLQDLGGWFGWLAVYFMDTSMYITVFVTVQKCCCVVFPLRFKNMFTKTLSWAVIGGIFLATLAIFMPVFVNIINVWFFNPQTKNKPLDWLKLNSGLEATIWRLLHRITLTIISQIIVVFSLAVITAKLKKSVKFRASAKSGVQIQNTKTGNRQENEKDDEQVVSNTGSSSCSSLKEKRAIQSVQVIALIFVVSTLPSTINSLAALVFPQLNTSPRYRPIAFTVQAFMYFGGTINASVNILVYLIYNTKYKTALVAYLGFQQQKQ